MKVIVKEKLILTCTAMLFSLCICAQTTETSHDEAENHEHSKNDIGLVNAAVYFLKEKEFAYGLHVHYVRAIPKSKFGLGLAYERIFGHHKHNTFGLVVAYNPVHELSLSISPGLTFEDDNPEAAFAMHLEATYGFEIRKIHLGPMVEFAYDPEDYHISMGLHLGYDF